VHIDRTPQALPRSPMFARRVHPPIIALFWFCRFRAPEPAPAYHPRGSSPRRVHAGRSLRSAASSRQLSAPASPSLFLRQEAATAYREALKELTRERVPLQWATTQSNLGLALWRLGERESGTTGLEEAVAAFRDALMERTRERVPLDWAQTQNNLGAALAKLGERGSGTARLEEAVAAFRDALKERTRERVPLQWAMSFGNQGIAMMRLAERSGDATMAAAALRQIEAALETARAGEYAPLAAHFESHLMEARSIHDALKAL